MKRMTKSQISNPNQAPNPKLQANRNRAGTYAAPSLGFGAWDLIGDLELGFWDFAMTDTLHISPAALTAQDDDRFHRFKLITWWDQQKLRDAKALVVGAGALGNEIVKNLALLGIGNILIADLDRIENSNLSRSVLYRKENNGQYKATVARRCRQGNLPRSERPGLQRQHRLRPGPGRLQLGGCHHRRIGQPRSAAEHQSKQLEMRQAVGGWRDPDKSMAPRECLSPRIIRSENRMPPATNAR